MYSCDTTRLKSSQPNPKNKPSQSKTEKNNHVKTTRFNVISSRDFEDVSAR